MNNKYIKRQGTSAIRGQLYETKLISLIYFRLAHDDRIQTFHLATNVDKIGSFDDICFMITFKEIKKPVFVFVQAKHKENVKRLFSYKIDLGKNFQSYLAIRYKFEPNKKDVLFKGEFDETQCLFVIYTNASNELKDLDENSFTETLNDLIGTDGIAKKPYKTEENVKYLCEIANKEKIIQLAGRMFLYINKKLYFSNMMSDDLVLRYHVIMSQKVFNISDIFGSQVVQKCREASFRLEFFNNNEEHIILFRDNLYKLVLKQRKLQGDITKLLSEFLENPQDVTALSKVIGTVITYNNGQLQLVKRSSATKPFQQRINKIYVSQLMVNQAMTLAAKYILTEETKSFSVPTSFGNKNLMMRDRDRLNHVITKIGDLLESAKSKIVTIDESIDKGLLKLNGGIASAVGNVLVLDGDTKLMKFTDNSEVLEGFSKIFYDELNTRINNLHEYRFNFEVRKFPELSFDSSLYERELAKDFFNRSIFFTDQCDEVGVGDKLKDEIEDELCNYLNNLQVRTDAIYLRYLEEIQAWWMTPKEATCLTKSSNVFGKVIDDIVKDRLMSIITYVAVKKTEKYMDYTFKEDSVMSDKLQKQSKMILIAENCELLFAKVIQHLKQGKSTQDQKKDQNTANTSIDLEYVVLDLKYILNLSSKDCKALCDEISNVNEKKVLIFICNEIQNSKNMPKVLANIAKATENKKKSTENNERQIIVVASNKSTEIDTLQKHLTQTENIVTDHKHGLVDMIEKSQQSILQNAKVIFQGKEVSLDDLILDDKSMKYVHGEVLQCVISQNKITIGKPVYNSQYYEIKHMYIDRRFKNTEDVNIAIETLDGITNDVMLVTAKPGMGKSTLLTNLSLKTKNANPKAWIVRINLLEYSREFAKWKNGDTKIDSLETLKLMCQVILREKLGEEHKVQVVLEQVDGAVQLKDCTGDHLTMFELRLFLHAYNRQKVIFLFDGFDEICPHYTNEVLECIKIVRNYPQKHKIWITTRPYNEIISRLQLEFGVPNEISPLSYTDRAIYLAKFWNCNLVLEELDSVQLDNVHEFIKYVSNLKYRVLQGTERLLHEIYINASLYLVTRIKHLRIPVWKYNKDIDDTYFVQEMAYMCMHDNDNSDGTPLHMYLTADYFQNRIKDTSRQNNKWDLDINTFDIYHKYLEMKVKKIWFEEKNKMDVCKPGIIMSYEKTIAELVTDHKKLAAYAIFEKLRPVLYKKEELNDAIELIVKGKEKMGIICGVADGIPIFTHMTLTEYYAVEYVCDMLKKEQGSDKRNSWLDFIFNVMFTGFGFENVRSVFDYKLKIDRPLMSVLVQYEAVLFDILIKQGKSHTDYIARLQNYFFEMARSLNCNMNIASVEHEGIGEAWAVSAALGQNLLNVISLFTSVFKKYLNKNHLDEFIDMITATMVLDLARGNGQDDFIIVVLDFVRNNSEFRLNSLLIKNFEFLSRSTNYEEMTSKDIVKRMHHELISKMSLSMQ